MKACRSSVPAAKLRLSIPHTSKMARKPYVEVSADSRQLQNGLRKQTNQATRKALQRSVHLGSCVAGAEGRGVDSSAFSLSIDGWPPATRSSPLFTEEGVVLRAITIAHDLSGVVAGEIYGSPGCI